MRCSSTWRCRAYRARRSWPAWNPHRSRFRPCAGARPPRPPPGLTAWNPPTTASSAAFPAPPPTSPPRGGDTRRRRERTARSGNRAAAGRERTGPGPREQSGARTRWRRRASPLPAQHAGRHVHAGPRYGRDRRLHARDRFGLDDPLSGRLRCVSDLRVGNGCTAARARARRRSCRCPLAGFTRGVTVRARRTRRCRRPAVPARRAVGGHQLLPAH